MSSIQFTGLDATANLAITGCDMLFTEGVEPSTALMRIIAAEAIPLTSEIGDLILSDGTNRVVFPDCAVVPGSLQRRHFDRDPHTWELRVMDRRWKWQFPQVSLSVNRRRHDGSITEPKYSARKMAEELLKLLGESNVDCDAFPDDVYPEVVRTESSVVQVLRLLLERHACKVGFTASGGVAVFALGETSSQLGAFASQANTVAYKVTPSQRPAQIKVVGSPHWFQTKFQLEAVGLDTDGIVKPIDDLSYKPSGGWRTQNPQVFADVNPQYRHLALLSVFRWYRIKEDGLANIPHNAVLPSSQAVSKRAQILPVYDFLVEQPSSQAVAVRTETRSTIEGQYWPYHDVDANTGKCTKWQGEFVVDGKNGIVQFTVPVYKIDCGVIAAADLYWTCSHRILALGGSYSRFEATRALSGNGDGDYPVLVPEFFGAVVGRYRGCTMSGTSELLNDRDLRAEAERVLDQHERRWSDTECFQQEFVGIVPAAIDAQISQVHFRVGDKTAPMTTVSSRFQFDAQRDGLHTLRRNTSVSQFPTADTR